MQVAINQELSDKPGYNSVVLFPDNVIYHKEYDHNKQESVINSVTLVFFKSEFEQTHETLKIIDGKVHYNGKIYQGYSVGSDEEDDDDDDDDDYYDDEEDLDYDDEDEFYNEKN